MTDLVLTLGLLLSQWPLVIGRLRIQWDTYDYAFPLISYLKDSFAAGEFPLWNPYILAGDAMFSQPASSVYHPFFLAAALLPTNQPYRVVEFLLLALPVIQGMGMARLFRRWLFPEPLAIAAAFALALASFGPLLGQATVACGIAAFPWLIIATENLSAANGAKEKTRRSSELAMLGGLAIVCSYFGVLVFNFVAMAVVLARRRFRNISFFAGAGVFALLAAAYFLWPAIENRSVWYGAIAHDFVSPDVRIRGMMLLREQVVDIVKNEQHLLSVLTGILAIEPGRPHWVLGLGYLWLVTALSSLALLRRDRTARWLWLGVVIAASYAMGPRSVVFELVFAFVPVVNNIRYPVFSFYLLVFLLACLAVRAALAWLPAIEKSTFVQKRGLGPEKVMALIAAILVFDAALFYQESGIFEGKAKSIIVQRGPDFEMRERIREVARTGNHRKMNPSREYDFLDRSWIAQKVPINQGYSTSDSPVFWYLKQWQGLANLVWPVKRIHRYPDDIQPPYTNKALEAIEKRTAELAPGEIYGSENWVAEKPCSATDIEFGPNRWRFHVVAESKCHIIVTDKNYPGWEITNPKDGTVKLGTVQWIFKGLEVEKGDHIVDLNFRPRSYALGATITGCVWLLLILVWAWSSGLALPKTRR